MKAVSVNEMRSIEGGKTYYCAGKKYGCTYKSTSWLKVKAHQVFCSCYWATKL